jgi:hypothetical protein
MEWQLGVTGYAINARQKNTKKGRRGSFMKGRSILTEDSFAARILGIRFQKTGQWGVKGSTMDQRVRNLIAGRIRSVTFIVSGWIPAIKKLGSVVKARPAGLGDFRVKKYGKDKGTAYPAIVSGGKSVIECIIHNYANRDTPKPPPETGGNAMPIAKAGLQAALKESARDMMAKLAERLNRDLKKYNAH